MGRGERGAARRRRQGSSLLWRPAACRCSTFKPATIHSCRRLRATTSNTLVEKVRKTRLRIADRRRTALQSSSINHLNAFTCLGCFNRTTPTAPCVSTKIISATTTPPLDHPPRPETPPRAAGHSTPKSPLPLAGEGWVRVAQPRTPPPDNPPTAPKRPDRPPEPPRTGTSATRGPAPARDARTIPERLRPHCRPPHEAAQPRPPPSEPITREDPATPPRTRSLFCAGTRKYPGTPCLRQFRYSTPAPPRLRMLRHERDRHHQPATLSRAARSISTSVWSRPSGGVPTGARHVKSSPSIASARPPRPRRSTWNWLRCRPRRSPPAAHAPEQHPQPHPRRQRRPRLLDSSAARSPPSPARRLGPNGSSTASSPASSAPPSPPPPARPSGCSPSSSSNTADTAAAAPPRPGPSSSPPAPSPG